MDLTNLWRNVQGLEKIKDLPLNEWLAKEEINDCSIILSPDNEFYIHSDAALQLYFWNYIEHREEKVLRWRQHQLGYVWFKKEEERTGIFSIPKFTIETDPDYQSIILERLNLLGSYIRPRFNNIYAGIRDNNRVTEISLSEFIIPLHQPEEVIRIRHDKRALERIQQFTP